MDTKDNQEHNQETKITSVVKEKIKDPRRVAQGKNLPRFPEKQKNVKRRNAKWQLSKPYEVPCKRNLRRNVF